jgi:imidazolonepropionase-like amidohydrolase
MILRALLIAHAAWTTTPDTTHYVVLNHGRVAGDMIVVVDGQSTVARYQYVDRGLPTRITASYRFSAQGSLRSAEYRRLGQNSPAGDLVERFDVRGDSVRWTSSRNDGSGAALADPNAFYRPGPEGPFGKAALVRFLLRQPRRSARLWPEGIARLEIAGDTTLSTPTGAAHLRLAMVFAGAATPFGIWIDERDELFADEASWFTTVKRGGESALPALREIEIRYRNAQAEALARRVARPIAGTLVIHNGDVFDSELGVLQPRTSVIVRGDRIVAVGSAESLAMPRDATVIDATGKTVIPGMWDMHGHTHLWDQGSEAPRQLAAGITTVRDLAADVDVAVSHRDRAAKGLLASPRLILAGFIEGPGWRAGPTDAIVNSAEEALQWAARYDSLGYRQVKLYDLVRPDLVSVIVQDAHRRGLRVSGHVPAGLKAPDVIRLGFDEINHLDQLITAFLPDSMLYPPRRRSVAIERGMVDVDGAEMTGLIELIRSNGTVVDPTVNRMYAQFGARVSPAMWDATFGRLLKRLFDANVTLVAGTDAPPAQYLVELELYERAGIPPAKVLQIATIVAARVMNEHAQYGSIAPGKIADLAIVDGRPFEQIADLRKVQVVIRAGRVYDASDLRAAVSQEP